MSPHGRAIATLLRRTLVERDIDGTRDFLATNFELHIPPLSPLPGGPWAWTEAAKFFLAGLSDVHLDIQRVLVDDERVAMRFELDARHSGPLGPYAATGKRVRTSALSLWRFSGPIIASAAIEMSLWRTLREIGAIELFNCVPVRQSYVARARIMTYRDIWRAFLVLGVLASAGATAAAPWCARRILANQAQRTADGHYVLEHLSDQITFCRSMAVEGREECWDEIVESLRAMSIDRSITQDALHEIDVARVTWAGAPAIYRGED
jgi:hypothetical protein